jgi:microcystin-dependent protein
MDPFIGEIRAFGNTYAPRGWAVCAGQLLPISQYPALFSLLGVMYGGNGTTNFALPNLMGQVAIGQGQLTGGNDYVMGETGGTPGVTLISTEMPAHTHTFNGGTAAAPVTTLTNAPAANHSYISNAFVKNSDTSGVPGRSYAPATPPANAMLNPLAVGVNGGSQPHSNMMPYVAINYCIALVGIFPQRP